MELLHLLLDKTNLSLSTRLTKFLSNIHLFHRVVNYITCRAIYKLPGFMFQFVL